MFEVAAVAGLAAFWLWFSIAVKPLPGLKWMTDLPGQSFWRCPWCLGAWLALAVTLLLTWADNSFGWHTPFVWLAAASIVGVAGSFVPDDGEI